MNVVRLLLLVFLAVVNGPTAVADNYPSRPIKFIVPWPAGGTADQRVRQIAEKLARAMGQPVIVENRPGASGAIGDSAAAKSAPDGYTLLWGTIYDLAINPAANSAPGYDPIRDFAPITQAVSSYLILDASPRLGVQSLKDLLSLAKAKPGELACASAGSGTAAHFALEILKQGANVDITHVPYKGEAPLLTDLLGGHVDMAFTVTTVALPYIKAGKLVPLAVSSSKRLPSLPDVPTMTELGFPQLDMTLWGGVLAPAGTPARIIKVLNAELTKIFQSPDIREQWASGGAQAVATTPEEFAALIQSEGARWGRLIKQAGVKME